MAFIKKISLGGVIWAVVLLASDEVKAFSEIATDAPYALLMDMETATILFQRNADTSMEPASMTKIVTIALLFDALKEGRVQMKDEFKVSANAVEKGGEKSGSSTMFLKVGQFVKVEDLIRGVVVQSGNDAAITIAENLAKSEDAFAVQMTEYARKIGMSKTLFKNATGLPQQDHETTPRDLALLARHHIMTYPQYYPYYAERSFSFNEISQINRNLLLRDKIGVDGLKTGHTESSGYGVVASAKRGQRRLIVVLNGLGSAQERRGEGYKILLWGFRAFQTYRLFRKGEIIEQAPLWHGEKKNIPLTVAKDFSVAITREKRPLLKVWIEYQGPIQAPVQKNQQVGWIQVKELGGEIILKQPLIVASDSDELGFFARAFATLEYILFGG